AWGGASQVVEKFLRRRGAGQKAGHEQSARRRAFDGSLQVPIVRHDAESARPGNAEPRSARFQVFARENTRIVLPPVERRGRSIVKLVAVAGEHQTILGMQFPSQYEQAHKQNNSRSEGSSRSDKDAPRG